MPWLTDWAVDRPEWWSLVASAVAWLVLLSIGTIPGMSALCLAPAPDRALGFANTVRAAWETGALRAMLLDWTIMTVAMMPPLAIPLIRHVAMRSFAVRRHRAVAGLLAGVLGVWLVVGLALVLVLAGVPIALFGNPVIAAGGFLITALWQLTPMKRRALLRCHRIVPLAPMGWRADRDCAASGVGYGIGCVTSCWAMMLATMLSAHGPVELLCVQFIALAERQARRPRYWLSALALVACAGWVLARRLT